MVKYSNYVTWTDESKTVGVCSCCGQKVIEHPAPDELPVETYRKFENLYNLLLHVLRDIEERA